MPFYNIFLCLLAQIVLWPKRSITLNQSFAFFNKKIEHEKTLKGLRYMRDLMHVLIWVFCKQRDKEQSDKITAEEHEHFLFHFL